MSKPTKEKKDKDLNKGKTQEVKEKKWSEKEGEIGLPDVDFKKFLGCGG